MKFGFSARWYLTWKQFPDAQRIFFKCNKKKKKTDIKCRYVGFGFVDFTYVEKKNTTYTTYSNLSRFGRDLNVYKFLTFLEIIESDFYLCWIGKPNVIALRRQ